MRWKTFRGQLLHDTALGAIVYQNRSYRWLSFGGGGIQTCIHRRYPENPVLSYIKPFIAAARISPGDLCLLGLGGAGVLHALAPYCLEMNTHAVESNATVIQLASDYFMLERLPSLCVEHQDAAQFLKTSSGGYQHLLVDIFTENGFPEQCRSLSFFEDCKRVLLRSGVLAFNLVDLKREALLVRHIRDVFQGATLILPIKKTSNVVMLAVNGASIMSIIEKLHLKKTIWRPQLGYIGFI